MVTHNVTTFRFPIALYNLGQAYIDSGRYANQSGLVTDAVAEQIAEDLKALQAGIPFEIRETRTDYVSERRGGSFMVSVRMHPVLLQQMDEMIAAGAAEDRTAYAKRAYANKLARLHDTPTSYEDIAGRLLSSEEFKKAVIEIFMELFREMLAPLRKLVR